MASSEERLTSLIAKCKSSSDVDAKVDAVTKLQAEFEAGVELVDIDGLIAGLKACLRSPNQHLSTATLSSLVPLFPLLVRHRPPSPPTASSSSNSSSSSTDSILLRQALNAFLSSGGIIDRLGDNREKAREKAKEALLAIGSSVFKSNNPPVASSRGKDAKGPESPIQVYERCLKEQGLASKSWRVREQSLLTLVQLRRSSPLFPLRPFLTPLVDALEDGDGTVRECARQSIVEIFSASTVTDAARADLKKEMTKKGVRKTIVDSVLAKLLGGEGRNTPSGDGIDGKEEHAVGTLGLPQRLPSEPHIPAVGRSVSHGAVSEIDRPASRIGEAVTGDQDTAPVYVASARDLENEFSSMLPAFEGKETEQNWAVRERSVIRIRGMLRGDAYTRYPEIFLSGLKNGVLDGTLKALASLRTTLASNACSLYNDLAVSLGSALDPFVETLLTHLLKMAGFTKKIIASASQVTVTSILAHTSCHPRQIVPLLWTSVQDKTVQGRVFAIGHVKTFVDFHASRLRYSIESTGSTDTLEKCVKKGLLDPNPSVREKARQCFWSFESVWKDKGRAILEGLDVTARKQLQNVCPVPSAELSTTAPSTPSKKKSSVAAAIAASRAKAKKIATAPPTLRHQATSTSHAFRATSPPVAIKTSTSPVATARTSSPLPTRSAPSPGSSPRSSNKSPTVGRDRQELKSVSPSPPSSPTTDVRRRRTSSPLAEQSSHRASRLPHGHTPSLTAHGPPFSTKTLSPPRTPLRDSIGLQREGLPRPSDPLDSIGLQQEGLPRPSDSFDPNETFPAIPAAPLSSEDDATDKFTVNLMTFSAPWEYSHLHSTVSTSSETIESTSRPNAVPSSVVEDALRARAAQAESAAEQLLELAEPDDGTHPSPIPLSLLPNNGTTPKPPVRSLAVPPVTPLNHSSTIMRQAALFQDSPAYNGGSPSIFELIEERKHQTGWWLKRMNIVDQRDHVKSDAAQRAKDIEEYITALERGVADSSILRKLILLCHRDFSDDTASPPVSPALVNVLSSKHLATLPPSPSPNATRTVDGGSIPALDDIWAGNNRLERLFNALCIFLQPDKDRELLEHGLFVLWEVLPRLDGRDADVLGLILRMRYAQDFNVDEGTLTIRDAQVELMNERGVTLYGLSTMDLCLKDFLAQPVPSFSSQDARLRAHAFGLITMAKFIIKLPADILEEELPRIKTTLTSAYLDREAIVRQSATTAITAAQVILRDETHLFAILEPLPDDKKNLLTYFFEKNNARGIIQSVDDSLGTTSMERLSSEMDRLDRRISTPPRRTL